MGALLLVMHWNAVAATTVGSSTLIQTLDYSDTFTVNGTTRVDNVTPTGPGLLLENSYGNPAVSWTANGWRMVTDSTTTNGTLNTYPGSNSAGSSTGLLQIANIGDRLGINYSTDGLSTSSPLRNEYVVQIDAVATSGRIEITSKSSANALFDSPGALSVFFKPGGIFIFDGVRRETMIAAAPTGYEVGKWQNFAVTFSTTELKIYTNQILQLSVDLSNVVNFLDPTATPLDYTGYSQQAVSFGFQTPEIGEWAWFDNFQVGAAVPEPSVLWLLTLGLGIGVLRKYRSRYPAQASK